MGRTAAEHADIVVVTNDNARGEAPDAIADAIVRGLRGAGALPLSAGALRDAERGYLVELDRARAIRSLVMAACPGDVVLVAGKGHENYQIQGADKHPFEDRVEAKRALALRRQSRASAGRT
jgi:UDP-N-acetylmuramoyl-L-alanyl-D-glutamate--2,6-diaminopimelate ligase